MTEHSVPKISKWPFLLGDLLFLGLTGIMVYLSSHPIGLWQALFCFACVGAGAGLSVAPFLQEYRAALKGVETAALTSAVAQIQNLEQISVQIQNATAQWQTVQEQSKTTVAAASQIAQRMSSEAKAFAEFMQKANDSEKANLRLEVDKLRRAEGEWLQIVTRILDHVYALHQAGVRSGQAKLIEQLGQFQNVCRDVVRRVGLVPFAPLPDEPFDDKTHQLTDPRAAVLPNARIAETIATGYSFQGQLLRRALVTLKSEPPTTTEETAPVEEQPEQPLL